MVNNDLLALDIPAARAALSAGDLSAAELTAAYLERIIAYDAALGAFITVTADEAREAAAKAPTGPLGGIPLALKNLIALQGAPLTAGSATEGGRIAAEDAAVTAALKAAGAVILGTLNMAEWAMEPINENATFGPCVNPWDATRTPGGSSGGAGAAIAAKLCLGALGTDSGGSVRIPAAFCGVVGFKPTYGAVSVRGVLPLGWHVDHVGPLARSATAAAMLFETIAGYDAADPYARRPEAAPQAPATLAGLRIGWLGGHFAQGDAAVQAQVGQALALLEAAGAHVEAAELPDAALARRMNSVILVADAADYHRERLAAGAPFEPATLAGLERGRRELAQDYAGALRFQATWMLTLRAMFERYDLLACPTTPMVAHRREEPSLDPLQGVSSLSFTAPFNLAGLPAISVPCGLAHGLPVGLQLIGAPWADRFVLAAAGWYEELRGAFPLPEWPPTG